MSYAEKDHVTDPKTSSSRLVIWPYRSLSPKGFKIIMIVVVGMMLSISIGFFLMGAWPVIGFMGLELLVLWVAFKLNYKAARRQEKLLADPKTFRIERVSPDGEVDVEELPSPWLKARLDPSQEPEESDRRQQKIIISSHGKSAEIGAFLHPAEKKELLPEINKMLDQVQK